MVGDDFDVRVLEPSPPGVQNAPFFADDPVDVAGADGPLIVPAGMPGGTVDWNEWLTDHPEAGPWVAERWLGGDRRLPERPAALATTREGLHRLAAYVIAPTRHAVTGKFGLRWTAGGFGTPFFGPDRQIRVEGGRLIDQVGNRVRSAPITNLRDAATFLGTAIDESTAAEHDTPPADDFDHDLGVDEDAATFLGHWFGMAFAGLELLRSDEETVDASRPQLWPGHFDPAIEVGDEDHRASYGASPGDASIPEPYLYVSVWWPDRLGLDTGDPFWDVTSFTGRLLPLSAFPEDEDPAIVAARFWSETRDRINQSGS